MFRVARCLVLLSRNAYWQSREKNDLSRLEISHSAVRFATCAHLDALGCPESGSFFRRAGIIISEQCQPSSAMPKVLGKSKSKPNGVRGAVRIPPWIWMISSEDDDVDEEVAAPRLAKARQHRDASALRLAVVKRQKVADVERYEAEALAAVDKIQTERDRSQAERDRIQVERARIQAERQEVEDLARADRDERDRQRVHAAELAARLRYARLPRRAPSPRTQRSRESENSDGSLRAVDRESAEMPPGVQLLVDIATSLQPRGCCCEAREADEPSRRRRRLDSFRRARWGPVAAPSSKDSRRA